MAALEAEFTPDFLCSEDHIVRNEEQGRWDASAPGSISDTPESTIYEHCHGKKGE